MAPVIAVLIIGVAIVPQTQARLVDGVAKERVERRRGWGDDASAGNGRLDDVAIQRRVIIRIPIMSSREIVAPAAATAHAARNVERRKGGPTCLPLRSIRGAAPSQKGGILFQTVGARVHATLERGCSPIAFQSGFYLDASPDDALCVGRDVLHARGGAGCLVTRFSRMP